MNGEVLVWIVMVGSIEKRKLDTKRHSGVFGIIYIQLRHQFTLTGLILLPETCCDAFSESKSDVTLIVNKSTSNRKCRGVNKLGTFSSSLTVGHGLIRVTS